MAWAWPFPGAGGEVAVHPDPAAPEGGVITADARPGEPGAGIEVEPG